MKEVITKQTLRSATLLSHKDTNTGEVLKQRRISKLKDDFKTVQLKLKANLTIKVADLEAKLNLISPAKFKDIDISAIRGHLLHTKDKHTLRATQHKNRNASVTPFMRMTLFNWLLEVSSTFRFNYRTVFLCGSIFDRYTRLVSVNPRSLQLLGLTCLYIASKFEDVSPPRVTDLCLLVDNIYTPAQFVDLESKILTALNYELVMVSPLDFVELSLVDAPNAKKCKDIALIVLQTFLVHGSITDFDSFSLSTFACSFAFKVCQSDENVSLLNTVEKREIERISQCYDQILGLTDRCELSWIKRKMEFLGVCAPIRG